MEQLPKIIALYLPQFHRIPENDKFWGEGFTDWVTVKNAKPIFEGHQQPRVPLNDNYYDLSQKENVAWQAKLAKEYGIYGFGIYHYWFNNEQNLLTKPAEIIRDNDDIDINYCFVWDNGNWIRSWSKFNVTGNDWSPVSDQEKKHSGPQILVNYVIGGESDWEKHYNYVSTHFKKDKYIKIGNKPVFCIMNPSKEIFDMCEYWDALAKKDGLEGMYFIFNGRKLDGNCKYMRYNYEPTAVTKLPFFTKVKRKFRNIFKGELLKFDYDKVWDGIIAQASNNEDERLIYGAFVGFDDTPRRGNNWGRIVIGSSPEKFEKYFSQILILSKTQGKELLFLSAWNEWGETMSLEPDTLNGYGYLEAVKRAMNL